MSKKLEVLLVDIGNSTIKVTEVIDGELQDIQVWEEIKEIQSIYSDIPWVVATVKNLSKELISKKNVLVISHQTRLPITLDYDTPETLGADRIVAAVGAADLFPKKNTLIIDIGTCITMDLIDKQGIFRGGVIAPGLTMRMKAMATYTDQLPDISKEWLKIKKKMLGKNTKECLLKGTYQAIIHEINGVVTDLEKNFTSLNIILTGGDAIFFDSKIKNPTFADSMIIQKGLYKIWKYQQ